MPEVYRNRLSQPALESGSLVVHCSDPRYQPHFQDFLRKGLGLERYGLIATPGGPQFLTPSNYLPKFSWAGWRWMKFMMGLTNPERVILIAHDDCRWYLDTRFGQQSSPLKERQIKDLGKVRQTLGERFGPRKVELYYAQLENGCAVFESL